MSKAVQTSVIGALQRLPEGEKPHLGAIRREVSASLSRDVSASEMRSALEALWFAGKLQFNALALSPSMRVETPQEKDVVSTPLADSPHSQPLELQASAPAVIMAETTGPALRLQLIREGQRRGLTFGQISVAVFGIPTALSGLRNVACPRPGTIEKAQAWLHLREQPISAEAIIEPPQGIVPIEQRMPPEPRCRENRSSIAAEIVARKEAALERADRARETRAPGETIAERFKRLSAELDAEEASESAAKEEERRLADLDTLETPSSVLRRAQRDWPDQCVKVRELAQLHGVQLGEIWRRVISAGVEYLAQSEVEITA